MHIFRVLLRVLFFAIFVLGSMLGDGTAPLYAQYWIADTTGLSIKVGSLAFAGNGDMFAGTVSSSPLPSALGVYRSTDGGEIWKPTPNPENSSNEPVMLGPVMGVNLKGVNPNGDIFAVGGYVEFRSTDLGVSWQEIRLEPTNGTDPTFLAFTVLPLWSDPSEPMGRLFFATGSTGPYISDEDGVTGSWSDEGDLADSSHPTFVASTPWGAIFEASATDMERGHGLNADTYDSLPGVPPLGEGIAMASNASGLIVVGGTGGLFFSLDTGTYWAPITPLWATTRTYYVLALDQNGDIFVGTNSTDGKTGGISISRDTGRSWQNIAAGLPSDTINALAFNKNGTLYAATDKGIFQYNPFGIVGTSPSVFTSSLSLDQNSPNPVSSTTTIQFSLPEAGAVSLQLYDPTGRMIRSIANGFYSPGVYSTSFDAKALPDGAYYYRLEAGGQSATRMFLVQH